MKRNPAIYILSIVAWLPLVWVIATVDVGSQALLWLLLSTAGLTIVASLVFAWRSHRDGQFLPNRCLTCENPMRRVRPGELKIPASALPQAEPSWRCHHCGRLV